MGGFGVDGSPPAAAARRWAAAEADRRGWPLHVVYALAMPLVMSVYAGPTRFPPPDEVTEQGRRVLAEAAEHVHGPHPQLRVEEVLALEDPATALLRRSSPEDLLVVGSRGLGAARSALDASVSVRLAARADCPVAVVPGIGAAKPADPPRRIVVGVDGSEKYLAFNRQFHFHIYRAARSAVTQQIIERLWLRAGPWLNIMRGEATLGLGLDYHAEILAALRAGDGLKARPGVVAAIRAAGDNMLRAASAPPPERPRNASRRHAAATQAS
jgi:nucleotide-binding universal stress UspA family protein